jgi:hypothetical protein
VDKGLKQAPTPDARDAMSPDLPGWLRLIRNTVSHLPAILAGGAVALYVVGVVSTLGELRASGVDVTEGMPLIPLEQHLLNGVGIVASGNTLMIAGIALAMYWSLRGDANGRAVSGRPWPYLVAFALVMLWVALAAPWVTIFIIAIYVGGLVALLWFARRFPELWRRRRAELYVGLYLLTLPLLAGLDAYFRSDPLPKATINTESRAFEGPLVATNGGVVYLAPRKPGGLYEGLAAEQIREMVVEPQRRDQEASVLELLGIIDR